MSSFRRFLFFILFAAILNLPGCKNQENHLPIIIFDTDMGSDCDDAGALAVLHHYADEGLIEIGGVIYSSEIIPYGVGVIDAINTSYGRPDLPIGASHGNLVGDSIDKMSAEKLAKDTTAFHHDVISSVDVPEQTTLNRSILANAPDNSIIYITVGHTRGLYELLISVADSLSPLNGKELIRQKVKKWVALGALRANNPEGYFSRDWNFLFNNTAEYTDYLVENLPIPSYFINAGNDVLTGKTLKHTPPGNIVRTVYRDWLWNVFGKTIDHQRPSWDLAAVYFAVKGEDEFLDNTGRGVLEFNPDKGSLWHPDTNSDKHQHYYVVQKPNSDEPFADYFNKILTEVP